MQVAEKKQSFTTLIDECIPATVFSDERHLAQVLTNILANAVKFTSENGMISLAVKEMESAASTCIIRFIVKDTGPGMTEEQQSRLFIPFEQADGGISRKFGGTGLGLSISKRIIELMDGSIWVESELGKGATFFFDVKVQTCDESKEVDNASSGEMREDATGINNNGIFKGKHILAAEDVDINREIIASLLEDTGIDITFAFNGAEAVRLALELPEKYSLILMDVHMPEMDGYTATKHIRLSGIKTPIVAMTANVFREDIENCLAAGMNSHLGKPLDFEKVLDEMKKYLGADFRPETYRPNMIKHG